MGELPHQRTEQAKILLLLRERAVDLGAGTGVIERDEASSIPGDWLTDGAERGLVRRNGGEGAQRYHAKGSDERRIDGVDRPHEMLAAVGDLPSSRCTVLAVAARITEHRVGDEHLVTVEPSGVEQSPEVASCLIGAERNPGALAPEPARGFGDE